MSETIEITPCGPLDASMRPPGSKSITNRALVCAALADGPSTLRGTLDSDDTRVMLEGLARLGITVRANPAGTTLNIDGHAGRLSPGPADLFVGNSGTTVRFLTALVTLGQGEYRLDGVARMRERPIGDLLDALIQLGADVRCALPTHCPPVLVRAAGLPGGRAEIRGDISSQFLSGLLMAAPYAEQNVEIVVDGPLVSAPYVRMTMAVMAAFGVDAQTDELRQFTIPAGQCYRGREYDVEPDASAASYFWAAAAIVGGRVCVEGLHREALQGDVRFCECLERMGCTVEYADDGITVAGGPLAGIDVDMNAISDTVQTLAAVALFADGPTTIRGVGHSRHKETDRIADLATELKRLGATVREHSDGLTITPAPIRPAVVQTYDDHRMAMSLALVGLRSAGIVIANPGCTAKTYPNFFDDLEALRKMEKS